ncbi:MAG TPA: NAD(P)-dependent oxidoreductase [Gammaproteobacteria bacterium]|nr:NAD(P)-dependent oxidoreductase [Gammaproteobacteria bacterium]
MTSESKGGAPMLRTGFIGLGAMGAPMARNLHEAGYLGGLWNRTPAKAQALSAETGVAAAEGPADLARDCRIIITCVSADADLKGVVQDLLPGLQAGAVVVDTSTVRPDTARAVGAQVEAAGGAFLDAPVSGGVEGARRGTLAMMVGGEASALDAVRPVLEAMAARIEHMGPTGAGQSTKAVNQVMVAGINQAVTEALAFAEALGLPLDRLIDLLGGGAAGNWFLDHRGPTMVKGQFDPGFKVQLHRKDLEICQAMAADLEVSLPMVEMTLVHYRRLMEGGHGDEDISALFREKQRLFGPDRPKRP